MKLLKLFPLMATMPRRSSGITIDSAGRLRELRESLAENRPNIIQTPHGKAIGPATPRSRSAK